MKYQTLKFLCAVGWGTVALVMAILGMWAWTELPIWDVVFRALAIYFVVMTFIEFSAEPKKRPQQKVEKPINKPRKLRIYNVRRDCWDVYDE